MILEKLFQGQLYAVDNFYGDNFYKELILGLPDATASNR